MPLRGIGPNGLLVRPQAKISQGRMFTPGSNEIVVGAGLLREFSGFELGKTLRFGAQTWKVVGVFEAPGTVFESELWADAPVIQSLFKRGSTFQTARVGLTSPAAMPAFVKSVKDEQRLQLKAQSEQTYFADQAERSGLLIKYFGWPLAEIATLRVIGFSGFSAFIGTMVEALVLSALGALVGVAICGLGFNGLSASTLGAGFTQVAFRIQIGPDIITQAVTLALIIGLIGGIFPGLRASRQRPLLALAT